MRTRFDQFGKQMIGNGLEDRFQIETDAEVPADTRRIDLWVTPREPGTERADLGLLGRIIRGSVTFEFFHNTPSGEELHVCLIKHGEFCHFLSRRKTLPPVPIQWVISAGRPDAGIVGLAFRPMLGWPNGIYESPPLHRTKLVVVRELPVTRATLLLRLLGAGATLKRAIAELHALPDDTPERGLALPTLVRLLAESPTDRAQWTKDEEEFMQATKEFYEEWCTKKRQQGARDLLLRQLHRRFGAEVDAEAERRITAASTEQVELWADRILSATTMAEVFAD